MERSTVTVEGQSAARHRFVHYLRTGRRLPETAFEIDTAPLEAKFNPYHDPHNGQFTFAPGGPRSLADVVRLDRRRSNPSLHRAIAASATNANDTSEGRLGTLATPAGRLDDGVYRPGQEPAILRPAQYRPTRPGGMGSNIRSFQDPMTLEQVFPGLRERPGGSVLALADNILDATGPGRETTTTMSLQYSRVLIEQIQAIDPSYNLNSFGFPSTLDGQMKQLNDLRLDRAEAFYRLRGETRPLQVETLRFLQKRTNIAYEDGLRELQSGRLNVRLSPEEAVGNYVDRRVRDDLRYLCGRLGISTGRDQKVRVNSREYDTSGTDRTYRRPDARVGDIAFDVTLTRKTLSTPQVRGFFNADFKPKAVLIIRPSQLGPNSTYSITRPGK